MVYSGLMNVLKSEGLAVVNHYRKVNDDDVKKIVQLIIHKNCNYYYGFLFIYILAEEEMKTFPQMTIFT